MNVREVAIEKFMGHERTVLKLPECGVILITGENGAGKSAIVEGVSVAFYNKTLRGTPAWMDREGGRCFAEATGIHHGEIFHAARERRGARTSLEWWTRDVTQAQEWETPTKAQTALEDLIGSFEAWRRCHVFSATDAAHFSMATDAERKRLIEELLGLDMFDQALDKCRADLKKVEAVSRTADQNVTNARVRLEAAQQLAHNLEGNVGEEVDTQPMRAALCELEKKQPKIIERHKSALEELAHVRDRLDTAQRAAGAADGELQAAKRRIGQLPKAGDTCTYCGEEVKGTQRKVAEENAAKVEKKAAHAKAAAEDVRTTLQSEEQELGETVRVLADKVRDIQIEVRRIKEKILEAEADNRQREVRAERFKQAEAAMLDQQVTLDAALEQHAAAGVELGELQACEIALGTKGIRAHILGKALGGIARVTNLWLGQLREGLQVRLLPYTEKKTGGVSDSLKLEIDGAGYGHGYKANSGGERRRVDMALLLGLAEIAAAARGLESGTLWLDEILDTLDDDGIARVTSALLNLGRTRCVVVISHAKNLVGGLVEAGAPHYVVEAGKIRKVS